jgi:hypothetical protein
MSQAKAADHEVQCLVAARAAPLEPGEKEVRGEATHEKVVEEERVGQGRLRRNSTQRWRTTGVAGEQRRRMEMLGLALLRQMAILIWPNRYCFAPCWMFRVWASCYSETKIPLVRFKKVFHHISIF